MKTFKIILVTGLCTTLSSCFKAEAPNTECDITSASIHTANPSEIFYNASDTLVSVMPTSSSVQFKVRRKADLTSMAPWFQLTPGATIVPANGSVHDFSQGPVAYRVTSEDGEWHREYTVSFTPMTKQTSDTVHYDFEHYRLDEKYGRFYEWDEVDEDGNVQSVWASGNGGFKFAKGSAKSDEYPTVSIAEGYDGACVRLTTCDTGKFGTMVNMPLAAGNLFLGEFDVAIATKEPLQATHFGIPFDKVPGKLTGYYKYKPGEKFQNKDRTIVEGKIDEGAIYAVFYKNHDAEGNPVVLHGDDVKTNPNIVGLAEVLPVAPTEEWRPFEAEFKMKEEIDIDLLNSFGYSLAVVFSASADGAYFQGAIGSTLHIDKVSVICTKAE